ncbi:Vps52-domain-containing protein [Ramicandelaber brevisporus]|nr:Vps52-domain-containing protein [Ramicandelaber brevisporus]
MQPRIQTATAAATATATTATTAAANDTSAAGQEEAWSILQNLSFDEVSDYLDEFQNDELIQQALESGLDLRQASQRVTAELASVESAHLEQYASQTTEFTQLNDQLGACDDILKTMESLLTGFQARLGHINNDIQLLHNDSNAMHTRLNNRSAAEHQLTRVIDGLAVPPWVITSICNSPANSTEFATALNRLNKMLDFTRGSNNSNSSSSGQVAALSDILPVLDRLRLKASSVIRNFFMDRTELLKSLHSNVQVLQKSVFLRYKALNHFLIERHREAATEIRDTYLQLVQISYTRLFENYSAALLKLELITVDKSDVLATSSHLAGQSSTSPSTTDSSVVIYQLGDRFSVLSRPSTHAVRPHEAEERSERLGMAQIFRSFHLTLVDNVTSEYNFYTSFFPASQMPTSYSAHSNLSAFGQQARTLELARQMFEHTFDATLKTGQAMTKSLLDRNYDALSVLMSIRIIQQLTSELQRRHVPVLEAYFNSLNMMMWPRLQSLMDVHIESVRKTTERTSDIQPHVIVRRYAELLASLTRLNKGFESGSLWNSMTRLRSEICTFIQTVSSQFIDPNLAVVFAINNYDCHSISNSGGAGDISDLDEAVHFRDLLVDIIASYVTRAIGRHFASVETFVQTCQIASESNPTAQFIPSARFDAVTAEFNNGWQASIREINAAVVQHFSSYRTGTYIMHTILSQMMVLYSQYHALYLARINPNSNGGSSDTPKLAPINPQTVLAEIRKYRS